MDAAFAPTSLPMNRPLPPTAGHNTDLSGATVAGASSTPTLRGDVAALAQAGRLERGAHSLGLSRPAHPAASRAGPVENGPASERARQGVGLALEATGQAYQSAASKFSRVTTRTYLAKAAHLVGGLKPESRVGRVMNRVGDYAARSAKKIEQGWRFTSHRFNYGFAWTMRGMGAVVSTGADLVQNGVPRSAREVGAMVAKNAITGVSAAVGGMVGSAGGPVGTVAGAVAAGQLMDGSAGRIADRLFGTSRYAEPAPAAASPR